MFVTSPGMFQPFGFPGAFPAYVVDDEPAHWRQRSPYDVFTSRQPLSRARRQGPHPQYHPRWHTTAHPWPTPGRHYHQPDDAVYDYDSDADDSAEEGEPSYLHPPTPARSAQAQAHSCTTRPSSSSCNRAPAGYGFAPQPVRQQQQQQQHRAPWATSRQPSPFAAHTSESEPEADHAQYHQSCCPQHARAALKQQRLQEQLKQRQRLQQQMEQQQRLQQRQQQARRQAELLQQMQQAQSAASAAAGVSLRSGHKGMRHIPVHTADVPQASTSAQHQQQAAPAPVKSSWAARQLSKSDAAVIIQSWWRMRRLARQQPALHALMEAAAQLRTVASKFDTYKAEAGSNSTTSSSQAALQASRHGFISHKQYLELNELAMRVLLQLDCTPCGVPELRAVRKRLAASAMSLLDSIQAAFSATITASMEVPDGLVQDVLEHSGQSPAATAHVPPEAHTGEPQQEQEGCGNAADGPCQMLDRLESVEACQEPAAAAPAATPLATHAPAGSLVEAGAADADACVRVVLRVAGQCCDAATQTD